MKVIKHADKPFKCKNCGCEFLCDSPNDIKRFEPSLDKYGFLGMLPLLRKSDYCICPECGEKIILKWY